MHIVTIIFIACGLAMDAFAVSITSGLTIKKLRVEHAFRIAFFFGAFQAIMPLVGWMAGLRLQDIIANIDHWIAFGLLSVIGCKMIYESFRMERSRNKMNPLNLVVLLMLSIATSIDALAVGVSLAFLRVSIITPIILIGSITFLLSFLGIFMGNRFGHFFEQKIEVIGGIILIGIGVKIVVEHLT
jgi:putative Mn2+ efflux pump MntP